MAAFLGVLAFIFAVLLALVATFYLQAKRKLTIEQQESARMKQQANTALARYKGITVPKPDGSPCPSSSTVQPAEKNLARPKRKPGRCPAVQTAAILSV
ncbi:MAG TPA: hypothetical protein VG099_02130, partial [Gemmataceae bacterium]|nr:hypothetical protein [Gemmataceae bacterium]